MRTAALSLTLWFSCVALGACGDDAGPCDGITCSGHGQCVVENGAAACVCEPGYDEDGLMCIDPTDPRTDQITQYGVTFTFAESVPFGRFANGDFWVLAPVTVTRITPNFAGGHHGWEVNPADTTAQGFDARLAYYDAQRVPALPYQASAGESLVKAISLAPLGDEGCRPCLKTAAVLTVVGAVPPDRGATVLRPPYFGGDKPLYSTAGLRLDLLPTLAAVGSPPTLDDVIDDFRRPHLDHKVN